MFNGGDESGESGDESDDACHDACHPRSDDDGSHHHDGDG
jgi:hypothetical protein